VTIRIETKSGEFELAGISNENILFSGLSKGLTLPYECATGTCGTCRARVMSGTVDIVWDAAPGFARLKRDKGDILMCQAHAPGDCVLRIPSDVCISERPRPRQFSGEITKTRLLTHDVVHFDVALDARMPFDAGQFVVLAVPGMAGGRAYSMVNYAPETDRLSFVAKKKPGGGFSQWMFGGAVQGSRIKVFGAVGKATFRPAVEANDLVIVAGGSGIAGMMSILDCAIAAGHFERHRGRVYFGVRTLADGFYLSELSRFSFAAKGALTISLVLSHENPQRDTHPEFPEIRLDTGFVHEAAARSLEGGAETALGFVAGPPPMVEGAIRVLLKDARIPARSIRYDKFG